MSINFNDSWSERLPRKRDRQWERQHNSYKVVYRGVDPQLSLRVKSIAAGLELTSGEVARALIGFALRAYEQDDLDLRPYLRPNLARRTLYPEPGIFQKSKPQPASWRVITTWRNFPPELKRAISALASKDGLNVPTGELVSALLRFGLNAHDAGLLITERGGQET